MPEVFISYSHKDGKYAHHLADELRRNSIDVWIDERIDYGDQWPRVIQENLNASHIFLLVMSTNAYNSIWVQNEVSYAQANNKTIFPLLLEGQVWLSMSAMQYIDVRGDKLPNERFIERLKNELGRPLQPVPPKHSRSSAKLIVPLSFGSLLALAGLLFYIFDPGKTTTPTLPAAVTTLPGITFKAPTTESVTTAAPKDDITPPTDVTTAAPDPAGTTPPVEKTTAIPPAPVDFTIDRFPLAVGDERTYRFGYALQDQTGKFNFVQDVMDVTERVTALEQDSNEIFQIYRLERTGSPIGLDCGGIPAINGPQTFWYIKDPTRLFAACDEGEMRLIVNALFEQRLMPNPTSQPEISTPIYLFPITVNAKWSRWADTPVSDGFRNVWFVGSQPETIQTFAGTFTSCYNISLETNSDVTMRRICPGIGLVSFFYRHFGSTSDAYGELLKYQLSSIP